ncbi:hypothetical protein MJM43_28460, partial [Salmonella enterica subsp. enterica serovar Montevideo]|nr:hypothetical protein [Salmonella enterica subsp. enterica serovar Montevideo]
MYFIGLFLSLFSTFVIPHRGHETADAVVVVDKLTYAGNLMSLASVAQSDRFAFEKVDICDRT